MVDVTVFPICIGQLSFQGLSTNISTVCVLISVDQRFDSSKSIINFEKLFHGWVGKTFTTKLW